MDKLDKDKELDLYRRSGMYINCVYCGHRYGPKKDTPVAMSEVLKQHIEHCPKHPLSKMKQQLVEAQSEIENLKHIIFETIIAPNCATCSKNMTNLCDNGIVCMSKVMNGEFVRWDVLKKDSRLSAALTELDRLKLELNQSMSSTNNPPKVEKEKP